MTEDVSFMKMMEPSRGVTVAEEIQSKRQHFSAFLVRWRMAAARSNRNWKATEKCSVYVSPEQIQPSTLSIGFRFIRLRALRFFVLIFLLCIGLLAEAKQVRTIRAQFRFPPASGRANEKLSVLGEGTTRPRHLQLGDNDTELESQ
jgi:hypothetical protein